MLEKNNNTESFSISKNICIGLFISGSMAYFADDDSSDGFDSAIASIENSLEKKLLPFRNGTVSFREKAKKILNKKKKSKKDNEVLNKVKYYNNRFLIHSSVANKAWVRLQDSVKNQRFTINYLIISLLYKMPESKKYYNFLNESLFSLSGLKRDVSVAEQFHNYAYSSLCVANLLLKYLEEEIDNYNKENYQ